MGMRLQNELKSIVSYPGAANPFPLLVFWLIRCHQNHVLFFFTNYIICSKHFWLWFQLDQFFPENMLPRSFPLLEGKMNLSFLLPTCWFSSSTTWKFTLTFSGSWEMVLYSEAGPSCLGHRGPFLPLDLSQAGPWGWSSPSSLAPHTFWEGRFPGCPRCVLRWKLAGQTLPHFFFFPFIFNLYHQTQLSHGILLVTVNTVLYLFNQHYGALTICQALGFKRSESQFLFCWNLVL